MVYRVLVSDNVHQQGVDVVARTDGFEIDVSTDLSPEDLMETIGNYHGLIIRSATKVTAKLLQQAANLKVIARAGTGLDNVDIAAATRNGVVVMNTPGGNSEAAAEHTLSLIMAAHRHIPQAAASMKDGKWDKKKYQGREIAGKTLGVIGLGKIGSLVAKLAAKGLKMKVLGFDPVASPEAVAKMGVEYVSLDEIFRGSDVITVHTPINDETRNLIDTEALSKMKDGIVIINCARSGIVKEDDLLEALESGKVAAAGIDVFSEEPPGQTPLVMHPRVIATPHLGASTEEAQVNVAVGVAEQIVDYLSKGIVRNAVNMPAVDSADRLKMEPYLDLARKLAQFGVKLIPETVSEMKVEYRGNISQWDKKPITNAALVGLLSHYEGREVNHVNAPVIAEDRGIKVSETVRKNQADFGSSLSITVISPQGTSVSLFGALIQRIGYEPRIIGIDSYVTEAVPSGAMLVVTNKDVPGMIAGMTRVLADSGINVAQMNLSRDEVGGTALSIINIDEPAQETTIEKIRNIEYILSAKQVILDD